MTTRKTNNSQWHQTTWSRTNRANQTAHVQDAITSLLSTHARKTFSFLLSSRWSALSSGAAWCLLTTLVRLFHASNHSRHGVQELELQHIVHTTFFLAVRTTMRKTTGNAPNNTEQDKSSQSCSSGPRRQSRDHVPPVHTRSQKRFLFIPISFGKLLSFIPCTEKSNRKSPV